MLTRHAGLGARHPDPPEGQPARAVARGYARAATARADTEEQERKRLKLDVVTEWAAGGGEAVLVKNTHQTAQRACGSHRRYIHTRSLLSNCCAATGVTCIVLCCKCTFLAAEAHLITVKGELLAHLQICTALSLVIASPSPYIQ